MQKSSKIKDLTYYFLNIYGQNILLGLSNIKHITESKLRATVIVSYISNVLLLKNRQEILMQ